MLSGLWLTHALKAGGAMVVTVVELVVAVVTMSAHLSDEVVAGVVEVGLLRLG